jgi:hypothetical protein
VAGGGGKGTEGSKANFRRDHLENPRRKNG